jgi:hypothetical protein
MFDTTAFAVTSVASLRVVSVTSWKRMVAAT